MSSFARHKAYATAAAQTEIQVSDYLPMVKKIAGLLISRLPASVDINDLVQVGVIGLMEAARQFDAGQGVQFETFASQRVRGAMLDELRRADWLPRQVRRNARQIEEAITKLEQKLGRVPQEREIAAELSLDLAEYQGMLGECKGLSLVHFGDMEDSDGDGPSDVVANVEDKNAALPLDALTDAGFRAMLVEAIKALPERDQLVMSLYYEQELNLKEIGAVLGVSESRVCQLHSQAIMRLRSRLKEWL